MYTDVSASAGRPRAGRFATRIGLFGQWVTEVPSLRSAPTPWLCPLRLAGLGQLDQQSVDGRLTLYEISGLRALRSADANPEESALTGQGEHVFVVLVVTDVDGGFAAQAFAQGDERGALVRGASGQHVHHHLALDDAGAGQIGRGDKDQVAD